MEEIQSAINGFLEKYATFIPESYWPLISLTLAFLLLVGGFLQRVLSAWTGFTSFFSRLFGKKRKSVEISPNPARVLRAVWLRDRAIGTYSPTPKPDVKIPIISFINMKGGVGKTTLAANIGAHCASKGARVLFIDFDYQGTLSLMVASSGNKDRLEPNSFLLLADTTYADVKEHIHRFDNHPKIGLFAAHYILFRDEMELFANWAANNSHYDIRYALKKILHDTECQRDWDIVIIDCGPRFTTSTINALCASTHVVIPVILDEPSAQAVGYLSKEFEEHHAELFPYLELLGVIPTMIDQDPPRSRRPKFKSSELEQLEAIEDAVSMTWHEEGLVLRNARIPDRAPISQNSDQIAYYVNSEAKRVFGRAADILLKRLKDEGYRTSWKN